MSERTFVVIGVALLGACGWLPTRLKDGYCESTSDCKSGQACQLADQAVPTWHMCVCSGPACGDSGTPADGPAGPDVHADVSREIVDASIDLAIVPDVAADLAVPDAAGTCSVNSDCTDPTKAFCVADVCVGCQTAGVNACAAPTPACDLTSGKCVGCTADAQCAVDPAKGFCVLGACVGCGVTGATGCSGRTDGKTVCAAAGTSVGQCVECAADTQCTKDPAKGFCVANACTGCGTTGSTGCSARPDGKVACAVTGTSTGQCVECLNNAGCTTDPAKGFCVNNACTGCQNAGSTACAGSKPACPMTGTLAGQCVECIDNTLCTANAAKHFCVSNACAGCDKAATNPCTGTTPACAPSTTPTVGGQCVGCISNAQCSGTTPICATATNTCRKCAADTDCSGVGPGVCMTDGHCAADAETIYVGPSGTTTCSDTTGTGSSSAPVCSAQAGVTLAKSGSKPVVLIRGTLTPPSLGVTTTIAVSAPLTIVGKSSAVIAPASGADALTITSGEIYLRNLTVQGSTSPATGMGIKASPDSGSSVILHIDTCAVINNPGGGILLNGAAFDIKNTTLSGNGPGAFGGSTPWGGILAQNPPTAGPANLSLVTIQNNGFGGLSCSGAITGSGVLAAGNTNTVSQIGAACGLTTGACAVASATCGAQSAPQ